MRIFWIFHHKAFFTTEAQRALSRRGVLLYFEIGYIVWGKYGFQMSEEANTSFLKTVNPTFPKVKRLYDLLKIEEGYKYWVDDGWEWAARFELEPGCISMKIFNFVQSQKNLDNAN